MHSGDVGLTQIGDRYNQQSLDNMCEGGDYGEK